jgi:hypothetical protein
MEPYSIGFCSSAFGLSQRCFGSGSFVALSIDLPCQRCLELRRKSVRLFGYSIPLIFILLFAFILGAKNPGLLSRIPVLNRI